MPKTQIRIVETPIGPVRLAAEDGFLTELTFGSTTAAIGGDEDCEVLNRAAQQLTEYFRGERRTFDLPLQPKGTPFQREVWQALQEIPYGKTASYGDIARRTGRPKAFRAVGMANHANPISIIIPCHRVVGSDGSLTGYGGGLEAKRFLLDLEQKWK